MFHLAFGQSVSAVFQTAYLVEDLESAIRNWVEHMGVGPWFLLEGFTGVEPSYRGAPTKATVTLAMAFSGNMCIELIQLDDSLPSPWREHVDNQGYGFHHLGKLTSDYDTEVGRHADAGHELVWEAKAPTGGRIGYIDTTDVLPGYLELVEVDEPTNSTFTRFYAASLDWDGSDPVRSFG